MVYRLFKASEINVAQRKEINDSAKNLVGQFCGTDFTHNATNPYIVDSGSVVYQNVAVNSLDDLIIEKIDPNYAPKITKPKNNIYDEENNKKLMRKFRELGTDTTTSEE